MFHIAMWFLSIVVVGAGCIACGAAGTWMAETDFREGRALWSLGVVLAFVALLVAHFA